jgi:hypothetical protein
MSPSKTLKEIIMNLRAKLTAFGFAYAIVSAAHVHAAQPLLSNYNSFNTTSDTLGSFNRTSDVKTDTNLKYTTVNPNISLDQYQTTLDSATGGKAVAGMSGSSQGASGNVAGASSRVSGPDNSIRAGAHSKVNSTQIYGQSLSGSTFVNGSNSGYAGTTVIGNQGNGELVLGGMGNVQGDTHGHDLSQTTGDQSQLATAAVSKQGAAKSESNDTVGVNVL